VGLYVVTNSTNGSIYYSTNGSSWNSVSIFPNAGFFVYSANGLILALGGYYSATIPCIYYSTNGTVWTGTNVNGTGNWVTYANGYYVAVGGFSGVEMFYSTNAATWTQGTWSGGQPYSYQANGVAYGNNKFVMVGQGGQGTSGGIFYSTTNGITWNASSAMNIASQNHVYSIAFGNGIFVAGCFYSSSFNLGYSTDGIIWTGISGSNSVFPGGSKIVGLATNGSNQWLAIPYNVSSGNNLAYSTNGTLWTGMGIKTAFYPNTAYDQGFKYTNGAFYYTNNNSTKKTVYMSNDFGVTWMTFYASSVALSDIVYGQVSGIVITTTTITAGNWSSVSLSSSTNNAIASANGSGYTGLYASTSGGQNWSATSITSGQWASVSLSSASTIAIAVASGAGYAGIYYSTNSGQNWILSSMSVGIWAASAISSAGQYAIGAGSLGIYTSTSFGQFWSPTTLTSTSWSSVALSATGQYAYACTTAVSNISTVYSSATFGQSWSVVTKNTTSTQIATNRAGSIVAATPSPLTPLYMAAGYGQTMSNTTLVGAATAISNVVPVQSTAIGYGATITASNQIVLGTATEKVAVLGDLSSGSVVGARLFVGGDVSFGTLALTTPLVYTTDLSSVTGARLFIGGDASLQTKLTVSGDLLIGGQLNINQYTAQTIVSTRVTNTNVLRVAEDISANNRIFVGGDVSGAGNLFVSNTSVHNRDVLIGDSLFVARDLSMTGPGVVYANSVLAGGSALFVGGLTGPTGPTGATGTYRDISSNTVSGNLFVVGDVSLGANLVLPSGYAIVGGDMTANRRLFVAGPAAMGSATVTGPVSIVGDISTNARLFVANDVSIGGNVCVFGPGPTPVGGDISANGRIFVTSDISANGTSSVAGFAILARQLNSVAAVTPVSGNITLDVTQGCDFYVASPPATNFGVAFTNVTTTTNQLMHVNLYINANPNKVYGNAITVNGTTQTLVLINEGLSTVPVSTYTPASTVATWLHQNFTFVNGTTTVLTNVMPFQ
jgi:hypothetical protein